MRGKKAKALRNMAIDEAPLDAGMRELVIGRRNNHDIVINHPNSVRAMERALKREYKKAQKNG